MALNPERLTSARTHAGLSQAELAIRVGVSQQTIQKMETGQTKRSRHTPFIAQVLGVHMSYLDSEYNHSSPVHISPATAFVNNSGVMPLRASAEIPGAGHTLTITDQTAQLVPRPPILDKVREAYAIVVEGNSMTPALEPGDEIWVNPQLGQREGSDVVLYRSDTEGGDREAIIRRLLSWTDTHWYLRQFHPLKDFEIAREEWPVCHRVIGKLCRHR